MKPALAVVVSLRPKPKVVECCLKKEKGKTEEERKAGTRKEDLHVLIAFFFPSSACKGSTKVWLFISTCWTQTSSKGSLLYSLITPWTNFTPPYWASVNSSRYELGVWKIWLASI